jgi:hypothetical protein
LGKKNVKPREKNEKKCGKKKKKINKQEKKKKQKKNMWCGESCNFSLSFVSYGKLNSFVII